MNIVKINDKNDLLTKQLVKIWENSVKSTHDFCNKKKLKTLKHMSYKRCVKWNIC
ncbi:hypothetical protein [Campylobacter sp. Cr9]|uniref:hypothetical protein n=1 Tax=Campylobacter sp. Cr9 TaxID=2735728 RepID=UPI003014243A